MSTSSRRGFTLVELLIVIAIIGMLMALIIPAVQAARERARMAECNSNIRQLAMAMKTYSTTGDNGYPGWASNEKTATGGSLAVPWTFKLLSRIDETTLREQILTERDPVTLQQLVEAPPKISLFNCPSDASTNPTIGTLTYVVNSGMPDPTRPATSFTGFDSDLKANGVCHDQRKDAKQPNPNPQLDRRGPIVKSGADLKDGEAKTILISENVHKDIQIGGETATWLGPLQDTTFNGTPEMQLNPEQRFGMIWVYEPNNELTPSPGNFYTINRDNDELTNNYADRGASFARPASTHPEVFIVAFCEGNTREVRENIDYRVYQALMTPNGQKAALYDAPNAPLEPTVRDNNDGKGFMYPPLNESDY
jgi:prepilin-type N-terminal cleavage/methylation domain-containing protein